MFGFEAVSAHNGWSMAVLGGTIVFSGLVLLSLAISQLHKLLELTEKRREATETAAGDASGEAMPDHCPTDIEAVAAYYQPLVDDLPQPFELAALYSLAIEKDFPHPHLTLRCFRESGILVPEGSGQFTWNPPS